MDRHQIEKIKRRKKRRKRFIDDHERRKAQENSFFNNHLKAAQKTVEETRYNLSSGSECRLSMGIFCNGKRSYADNERDPNLQEKRSPKKKMKLQAAKKELVDNKDDISMTQFGKGATQYLNKMFPKLRISTCESAAILRKQVTTQASKKGYLQILAKETAIKTSAIKKFEHANRRIPTEERYRSKSNDMFHVESDLKHFPSIRSETTERYKRQSDLPISTGTTEYLDFDNAKNFTDRSLEMARDFHTIDFMNPEILKENRTRPFGVCRLNNLTEFDHHSIPLSVVRKDLDSFPDVISQKQVEKSDMDYYHPLWDTPNEIKALNFTGSRCMEFYSPDKDHRIQSHDAFDCHLSQHRYDGHAYYTKLKENIKDLGYIRSEATMHLMGNLV